MTSLYTSRIDNCCFWCSSDNADFAYIIECDSESDFDKAMEIAERELGYWCCPEDALEDYGQDLYNYYYNAGYVEVVEDALDGAGIRANYYVNKYE